LELSLRLVASKNGFYFNDIFLLKMEKQFLIDAAKRIAKSNDAAYGVIAEALEFLRIYAGERSSFFKQVNNLAGSLEYRKACAKQVMDSYIRFLENGLIEGMSIERRAKSTLCPTF
jgi:hypothetical protein